MMKKQQTSGASPAGLHCLGQAAGEEREEANVYRYTMIKQSDCRTGPAPHPRVSTAWANPLLHANVGVWYTMSKQSDGVVGTPPAGLHCLGQ